MIYLDHHTRALQDNGFLPFDAPYSKVSLDDEQILKDFVGAGPKDFAVITSSAAEAISQVFETVFIDHVYKTGRNHVLSLSTADAPILLGAKRFESLGLINQQIETDGHLTRETLEKWISPRTSLLSISWAHSLTGVSQPIWDIADFCKEKGIFLHVDVTQVLGRMYFRFDELPIDFLTFDGKGIHGPICSGMLFAKKKPRSLIPSGSSLRGGEYPHETLKALALSAKRMEEKTDHMCLELPRLRSLFETLITTEIPQVKVLFENVERIPHISCLSFPGIHADLLLHDLIQKQIYASVGGGETQRLEDVLLSQDALIAKCALSFGLSYLTTEEDIRQASKEIVESMQRLAPISQGALL